MRRIPCKKGQARGMNCEKASEKRSQSSLQGISECSTATTHSHLMTTTAQLPVIIIIISSANVIITIIILFGPAALHHWLISWRLFSPFCLFFLAFRFVSSLLSPLLMCKIALTIWMPPHWAHPTTTSMSTSVCPPALEPPPPCERLLQRYLARGVYVIFLLKLSLVALCARLCCARRRNTASWRKSNHFLMSTQCGQWAWQAARPGCAVLCAVFNENMKVFFILLRCCCSTKSEQINKAAKKRFSPCVPHFVPQKQQHKQWLQV